MWHAHVQRRDVLRRHVEVFVYEDFPDGTVNLLLGDGSIAHLNLSEQTEPEHGGIRVPVNALPALMGALAHHLGAVEHPVQLRGDFEYERARVDRLTDALINLVQREGA